MVQFKKRLSGFMSFLKTSNLPNEKIACIGKRLAKALIRYKAVQVQLIFTCELCNTRVEKNYENPFMSTSKNLESMVTKAMNEIKCYRKSQKISFHIEHCGSPESLNISALKCNAIQNGVLKVIGFLIVPEKQKE